MSVSLSSAINTCKVPPNAGDFLQGERLLDYNNVICMNPRNTDYAGREICPFSNITRSAGCNSPLEAILTENSLRPNYIEFMNASNFGIKGDNLAAGWNNDLSATIRSNCCPQRLTNNFLPTKASCPMPAQEMYLEPRQQMSCNFAVKTPFDTEFCPQLGANRALRSNRNAYAQRRINSWTNRADAGF